MAAPELSVRLRGLAKSYWRGALEIPVLTGVDLDIPRGGYYALMGPSGSGKTTLLNLIAGIDRPTGGELEVCGYDLNGLDDDELAGWRSRNVGFIFQNYNLIPVLTAFENVELPLLLTDMARSERRDRVDRALRLVNLADRMRNYPRQLSGGQEQRVAIARAIVHDPGLLVADEPTGALDARNAEEALVLLEHLNQELGKTIVLVTHDPKAAQHARVQIHLEKGVLDRTVEVHDRPVLPRILEDRG
ncbi:ABC transporter ATP-binding protein [Mesoterricola sediminis]|uniref:ABC transporter ATP-binding protein n=1 Tax=Mesoterricola sediminis TaxID=2927980 RepID=A0AA48H1G3_9BACT|nr:ABC transporter ATP-binding protein [Mesoterricola sediminis]BDU78255.1 ABC transporter ATP-binding protein [Mesoterricola sediminis]